VGFRFGAFTAVAAAFVSASVPAAACNQAACGSPVAPLGHSQLLSNTQIQEELRRIHQQAASLPQRVEAISELFLGVPYKLGALGEGPGGEFDRDPMIRFDAFDCTTFVETVMALALNSDLDRATRTLQKIRYKDGQIGYATRNHFIELDWVPNNVRTGYLRDITSDVAGRDAVKVHKAISKRRWYLRKSPASLEGGFSKEEKQHLVSKLRHLGKRFPDERATLTVVPLKALPQALAKIPSGTIANLVHADRRDRATIVSHQVLLIKKSDGWYMRHAALGKAVEDDPIGILGSYRDLRWRLIGLNFDVLHDPTSGKATH
jgi:N-acetylmuramoyl-L-alanine amidase-like